MNIPDSYWSAEPPTKPGWYAWRYGPKSGSVAAEVLDMTDFLWCRLAGDQRGDEPKNMGGLWCRLVPEAGTVPKEEVHRAFVEAQSIDYKNCAVPNYAGLTRFENSRARKVMEGTL